MFIRFRFDELSGSGDKDGSSALDNTGKP